MREIIIMKYLGYFIGSVSIAFTLLSVLFNIKELSSEKNYLQLLIGCLMVQTSLITHKLLAKIHRLQQDVERLKSEIKP